MQNQAIKYCFLYLYLHARHHQLLHRNQHPTKQRQWQSMSLSLLIIQGNPQHAPDQMKFLQELEYCRKVW